MTLVAAEQSFWQRAPGLADKVAVVDPDGSVTKFSELYEAGNRVANGLADLDLADDDVVAMMLKNSHTVYEVFSAALQSGAYLTPVNWHLKPDEIAYILQDSGAKVLIADGSLVDQVREAADLAGIPVERRFLTGAPVPGFRSYDEWKAQSSPELPSNRRPGHRLYYTSGTTGRPKAVLKPRPRGDTDATALRSAQALFAHSGLSFDSDGVHLVTGPMYHPSPLGFGMGALQFGQTVVLMDKWDAEETLRLIEAYGVTGSHFVPTMFHRMLRLPEPIRVKYNLSTLQTAVHAAAPCPPADKQAMLDWFGPIVHEYYSSSEIGGTQVSPEEWLRRPGTVGRPYPGVEMQVISESGAIAKPNEPGLIYFKVATPFEYKGEPEKTQASRRGDFATVGDIGYVDEEGYLFLCDRASEMIISGGVNIYPAEVEAAVMTHPAVEDCAVVGVPDAEWGEQVKAVVQLVPGYEPSDELGAELIQHTLARVAKFKCPRSVDFISEVPRNQSGKLLRRNIRTSYWDGHTRGI